MKRPMRTSLRLTSLVIVFIGAYLITTKIADTASAVNSHSLGKAAVNEVKHSQSRGTRVHCSYHVVHRLEKCDNNRPANIKLDTQGFKQVNFHTDLDNDYEPPNYGGPDSHHGTGTR